MEEISPEVAVLLLSISGASVLGSLWMLKTCSSDPPRLLKRQLSHQACATILFHVLGLVLGYAESQMSADRDQSVHPTLTRKEKVIRAILHGCFFLGCLAELHIASSIAAAAHRSSKALDKLGEYLPFIWPVALAYIVSSALLPTRERTWEGEVDSFACEYQDALGYDFLGAWFVLACFVSTFLLYVSALSASKTSNVPDVVLQRMRRRAMVYPVIFMITGGPTCARYFGLLHSCSFLGQLSILAEIAAGALNALALYLLNGEANNESKAQLPSSAVEMQKTDSIKGGAFAKTSSGKAARSPKVVGFKASFCVTHIPSDESHRLGNQWSKKDNHALAEELENSKREMEDPPEGTWASTSWMGRDMGGGGVAESLWHTYVGTDRF